VLPAAFLFGLLKGGGLEIGFRTDVPTELVGVLRGLIILFVAMPEFFRMIGRRTGIGGGPSLGTGGGGGTADDTGATDGGGVTGDGGVTGNESAADDAAADGGDADA